MRLDPLRVACWRFEQISPLLDARLTAAERRRMIAAMARVCGLWPSGRQAPIPVSTTYRWLKAYKKDPRIESLLPEERHSQTPAVIRPEWLQYALSQLEEEPNRSLFILSLNLKHRFDLPKRPSRSSLHRALSNDPRYIRLRRRARGETRLRRRFQAQKPHEIWHADAKAVFSVRFRDLPATGPRQAGGSTHEFRILSILDDATRFVLCALIVKSESVAAAVATFCAAAARWGLPQKFYADRGSAYDSYLFRKGLAVLGVHRINTKSHNPSAHGKIEAYHRVLHRWFIRELKHQPIRDSTHLQQLLDAVIDQVYHQHPHRELKRAPREALGNTLSNRLVPLQRLQEAFTEQKTLTAHKKTGEVRIGGKLFIVPKHILDKGRKVRIAVIPDQPDHPCLILKSGKLQPLVTAFAPPANNHANTDRGHEPIGSLTPLLETYRGRTLPQAKSGFGLPEIYEAFSHALGRAVPSTEAEADTVLQWLQQHGPFDPKAFALALRKTISSLGQGRPLIQILASLTRKINRNLLNQEQQP